MTDTPDSRLAVLETEMKNEIKNREDLDARIATRITKIEANIRSGVAAVLGLLANAAFNWFKGG